VRAQRVRGPIVQVETTAGRPIPVDDQVIVPVARSVLVQVPGVPGGLIWNRPVSVVVRAADGTEYQLPVHDVTRRVQLLVLAIGALGSLLIWLLLHRR
jgi:hypothetical protein